MRSHTREEKRLLREQATVGALRDERREQERLGAQPNLELVRTRAKSRVRPRDEEEVPAVRARRAPRPGKPLKR